MKKLIFTSFLISSLVLANNGEFNIKAGVTLKNIVKFDENKNTLENIKDFITNQPTLEETSNKVYDYFLTEKGLANVDVNLNAQYLKPVISFAGLKYKIGAEVNASVGYNYIKNTVENKENFNFINLNGNVSLIPLHLSYNALNIVDVYAGAKAGIGKNQFITLFNKDNAENSIYKNLFDVKNNTNFLNIPIEAYLGTVIKNSFIIEAGFGDEMNLLRYNKTLTTTSDKSEYKYELKHNIYGKISLGYSFR